jgi:uncharacterized protein YbjT (DUF2867 family)
MRIFIVGATGVLGRALMPQLSDHEVVGLTRNAEKVPLLQSLGAEAVVGDAYDASALKALIAEAQPEVVVNFLTDLADGNTEANARIRREVGPTVVAAAAGAGARLLVIESVAFTLEEAAADAAGSLEQGALNAPLESLVLRFGRLWGPGTWYDGPPELPRVHVDEAGRRAAELIVDGATGIHDIA